MKATPPGASPDALAARVDGTLLPPDEARELWARFSAHMEANKGDLFGFAAAEGFASIRPGLEGGRPVLLASRSKAQEPYRNVSKEK